MAENRQALLNRLETEARKLRRNVWRALRAGGGGHAGGSSSAADILTALYFHRMHLKPSEPEWPDRDRFVLSNGHGSMLLYSLLHLTGYDLSLDDIADRVIEAVAIHTKFTHPADGAVNDMLASTGIIGVERRQEL